MKKISIQENAILQRNDDKYLSTEVDGETVIMNVDNGAYLGLNSVSSDIWEILENETPFNTLIETLLKTYEVTPKECKEDTTNILSAMIQMKAVNMSN